MLGDRAVQDYVTIEERRCWLKVKGHPDPDGVVGAALLTARLSAVDPVQAVREAVAFAAAALVQQPTPSLAAPARPSWWRRWGSWLLEAP